MSRSAVVFVFLLSLVILSLAVTAEAKVKDNKPEKQTKQAETTNEFMEV